MPEVNNEIKFFPKIMGQPLFAIRATNYNLSASEYQNKRIIMQQLTWPRAQMNHGCSGLVLCPIFRVYCAQFFSPVLFIFHPYSFLMKTRPEYSLSIILDVYFFTGSFNYKSKIDWNHDVCCMIVSFQQTFGEAN